MAQRLYFSNCFIQALKIRLLYFRSSKMGFDFDSPSRLPSFYCDVRGRFRFKFRRKLRRYSNKGILLFWGYTSIKDLKTN